MKSMITLTIDLFTALKQNAKLTSQYPDVFSKPSLFKGETRALRAFSKKIDWHQICSH